jgi:hypothetical protein
LAKDVDNSKLPFEIRSRRFLPMDSPDKTARQVIDAIQDESEDSDAGVLAAAKTRAN